jgi:hypothetical protein
MVQWLGTPTTDPATRVQYPTGIGFFCLAPFSMDCSLPLAFLHRNSTNDMRIIYDFFTDWFNLYTYIGSSPWFTPLTPANHCRRKARYILYFKEEDKNQNPSDVPMKDTTSEGSSTIKLEGELVKAKTMSSGDVKSLDVDDAEEEKMDTDSAVVGEGKSDEMQMPGQGVKRGKYPKRKEQDKIDVSLTLQYAGTMNWPGL